RSEQVACGHMDLIEEQFRRIGGEMAELVEVAAVAKAFALGLDEDEAHAARPAVRVGPDDYDDKVAHLSVRDERLLAGDDVFIAFADCACANALQVAAGPGLGHCYGAYSCAGDHARQPFLLLLLGAVVQQRAAAAVD